MVEPELSSRSSDNAGADARGESARRSSPTRRNANVPATFSALRRTRGRGASTLTHLVCVRPRGWARRAFRAEAVLRAASQRGSLAVASPMCLARARTARARKARPDERGTRRTRRHTSSAVMTTLAFETRSLEFETTMHRLATALLRIRTDRRASLFGTVARVCGTQAFQTISP